MLEVCLPLLLLFLANAEAESSSSSSGCTELDVDFWQSPWIGKPEIEQVAPNEVVVRWGMALPSPGGAGALPCPLDSFFVEFWPRGQLGRGEMRTTTYPPDATEAAGIRLDPDGGGGGEGGSGDGGDQLYTFRVVAVRDFLTFDTEVVRVTVSGSALRPKGLIRLLMLATMLVMVAAY